MPAGCHRVFDSWPLLALLEGEPASDQVRRLILAAQAASASMWITVVNAGEIWYNTARRRSAAVADETVRYILELGFELVAVDWILSLRAARWKARYPVSYADCLAAALAKERNAELVTGDPDFRLLEKEIRVYWL